MNSSLSDRASANQAFLDALDQLDETFGDVFAPEAMPPLSAGDAQPAAPESDERPHPKPRAPWDLPPKPRR